MGYIVKIIVLTEPLGYRRLSILLNKLEDSHTDLQGSNITAHALRRTWNDYFRELGENLEANWISQKKTALSTLIN